MKILGTIIGMASLFGGLYLISPGAALSVFGACMLFSCNKTGRTPRC